MSSSPINDSSYSRKPILKLPGWYVRTQQYKKYDTMERADSRSNYRIMVPQNVLTNSNKRKTYKYNYKRVNRIGEIAFIMGCHLTESQLD
jgi:hypothetical protein